MHTPGRLLDLAVFKRREQRGMHCTSFLIALTLRCMYLLELPIKALENPFINVLPTWIALCPSHYNMLLNCSVLRADRAAAIEVCA